MKVTPIFLSKESMLKKIAKRNSDRLFKYTEINLSQEIKAKIGPLIDSLSRYGENKNIIYGFENAENSNLGISAYFARWQNVYWPTRGETIIRTIVNPNGNLHEISNKIKRDTINSVIPV